MLQVGNQHPRCECHECTQARWKMQSQLNQLPQQQAICPKCGQPSGLLHNCPLNQQLSQKPFIG